MNCLKSYGSNRFLRSTTPLCRMTSVSNNDSQGQSLGSASEPVIPEEPTTCCMSGCANCVWIEYADQLGKLFGDSGQKTRDIVLSKVSDPNMKAFLLMELKALEKCKEDKES